MDSTDSDGGSLAAALAPGATIDGNANPVGAGSLNAAAHQAGASRAGDAVLGARAPILWGVGTSRTLQKLRVRLLRGVAVAVALAAPALGQAFADSGDDCTQQSGSACYIDKSGAAGPDASPPAVDKNGIPGTPGSPGGTLTHVFDGPATLPGQDGGIPILLLSGGGTGGAGSDGSTWSANTSGGDGGNGGDGGQVTTTVNPGVTVIGNTNGSPAVMLRADGGAGGKGARGSSSGANGIAGDGGNGGALAATLNGSVTNTGSDMAAAGLFSLGGNGGNGASWAALFYKDGVAGGNGGNGGSITATVGGSLDSANGGGLIVQSVGGTGGNGGKAGTGGQGGTGGNGGSGGTVSVTLAPGATVSTGTGATEVQGVWAQSLGGIGGQGGPGGTQGGIAGSGADGGPVSVINNGTITIAGQDTPGILAQSLGGVGANGGKGGGWQSGGGQGGTGGSGGSVTILGSGGSISTAASNAAGIIAQSIGGGGGAGGDANGWMAIGGDGGPAANGSNITVNIANAISTAGERSEGILAQSIGGGGGNGGNATGPGIGLNIVIGGRAGDGGVAGQILASNGGFIATAGLHATGLLLQSIGGGGGKGGAAYSADSSGGFGASVSIGGSGGGGGNAGPIGFVADPSSGQSLPTNDGQIITTGGSAFGVLGQSIGGGGGVGGASAATAKTYALATDPPLPTISVAVAIGGSGGAGGSGDSVGLANAGYISTRGPGAAGLVGQSIGGGGGTGGDASATATAVGGDSPITISTSISLGGSGGTAGDGGAVTLANSGLIATAGESADGMLAQSIGGGGGSGGAGDGKSSASGTNTNVTATLNLGGSAAGGGSGGAVTATNTGAILTLGDGAGGIVAQQIGGGGGRGGGAAGSAGGASYAATVNVGGTGGFGGGASGAVSVANTGGSILTFGASAPGILAQSIGGGGGAGGKVGTTLGTAKSTGDGGNGAASTIDSTTPGLQQAFATLGNAATDGFRSTQGLIQLANQYLGNGSSVSSAALGADPTTDDLESLGESGGANEDDNQSTAITATIAIGGKGGSGGAGGAVNITTDAASSIATVGVASDGIIAQSIGGGGGTGGAASTATSSGNGNLILSLGGSGGGGGNGGPVTVTNDGPITTVGAASLGILAQSISGGGGVGGASGSKSGLLKGVTIGLGSTGGSGGTAGTVAVTSSAPIITLSHDAIGIVAQSIGGGGGLVRTLSTDPADNAGNGGASPSGGMYATNLTISGNSVAGNSGQVSVTTGAGGSITTSGDNAYGILAQSIGGGGGAAIGGKLASVTDLFSGGTVLGSAASVGVDVSGNIITSGRGAIGIVAQSIGGGGGIAGDTGWTEQLGTLPTHTGTRAGYGGSVGVTVRSGATVATTAPNTPAILAQSIGGGGGRFTTDTAAYSGTTAGEGASGTVGIAVGGTVSAAGAASPGIFAQSVGAGGTGQPITVSVGSGSNSAALVSGGTNVNPGDGSGAGVYLLNGSSNASAPNVVDNYGTITSVNGANGGTAIFSAGGYTKVTNETTGTITGAITLDNNGGSGSCSGSSDCLSSAAAVGASRGDVVNNGVIQTVSVRLGGGTLTNASTLDVRSGGSGVAVLDGNYHATTGVLHVGADFAHGTADRLAVTGNVELDPQSSIRVDVANWQKGSVQVLTAGGTLIQDPPAANATNGAYLFGLQTAQSGNTLQVQTVSNIRAASLGLTENQQEVARNLERIWNSDPGAVFAAGTAALATVGGDRSYRLALNTLAGAAVGGIAAAKQAASDQFTDNLINCEVLSPDDVPLQEKSCGWMRVIGGRTSLSSSGDDPGYRQNVVTTQLGGQIEFTPGWFVGASAGQEASWLEGDDASKVSGQTALFGLMLKRQSGPWLLTGVVDGGYGWYRSSRQIEVGSFNGQANGSPNVAHAGLHLRAAYQVLLGDWYMKPNLTVEALYRGMSGYSESGSTPFNLNVRSSNDVVGGVSPMIEFGRGGALPGIGVLRGSIGIGAAFYINNDWTNRASFQLAPAGVGTFNSKLQLPDAAAKLNAGLDLFTLHGFDVKLDYAAQLAPGLSAQTLLGRLSYVF